MIIERLSIVKIHAQDFDIAREGDWGAIVAEQTLGFGQTLFQPNSCVHWRSVKFTLFQMLDIRKMFSKVY